MPTTLYSTSDAFPILTGYSTRSFDSGLLLWQGTYITRDTSAPPFAEGDPIPDGDYGAIDGLYVHPAPVLKKSPGPLAEWTVTAYGRLNTKGKSAKNLRLGRYSAQIFGADNQNNFVQTDVGGRAFLESVVVSRVVHKTGNRGELLNDINLKVFKYPASDEELAPSLESDGFIVFMSKNIERFDTNNFGMFLEIIYSVSVSLYAVKDFR